jgi:(2S)-methylsuccinyl-CoA dehydrogenase
MNDGPGDVACDAARQALTAITHAFEGAVDEAARQSTRDGRIDAGLSDALQIVCYELAVAHADLLAGRTMLATYPDLSPLDRALALIFVAETADATLGRLETVYLGLSLSSDALQALRQSTDIKKLRASATPTALADAGCAVIDADGTIGDVALDDMTAMAMTTFRRFAQDVVAPLAERIHREDLTVPEALLQPMRELGVFGLSIPEVYGGTSGARENTPMMIAVTEALSEASLAAAGSLITRPEILSRALLAGGTEEQKRHWLPRIAAGDPLCAISITEPDYGSDVASLSLRATRTEGGWLLDGAKTWCTFAGKAGLLMVVARTDPDRSLGHRGLSLLLVEKPSFDGHEFSVEQPGGGQLSGRAIATIGYRGMHSFDLGFERFFVPETHVIGGEAGLGKGFYLTMAGMTGGRIQTAGRALGVMRAALKAAIRYARDRKVFGATLGSYQLTQVRIAQMAALYVACRHLAFAVGKQLDEGGNSADASLVKLIACRAAERITRDALQIHGGMGYAEETAVSRYWIDARVLSIFEGAEETLALKVVARGLLEEALKRAPH